MSHLRRPSFFAPFLEALTPISTVFETLCPYSGYDLAPDDDTDPFTLNLLDRFDRSSSPYGSEDWSPSLQIGDFGDFHASDVPDYMDSDDPSLDLGLGSIASASDSFDSGDVFDLHSDAFEEDLNVPPLWILEPESADEELEWEEDGIDGVVEEVVELEEVSSDVEMGYDVEQALADAMNGVCADDWRDANELDVEAFRDAEDVEGEALGDGEGAEVDVWGDADGVGVEVWDNAEGVEVEEWGDGDEADAWGDADEAVIDMWGDVDEVEAEVWEVLMGWDGLDGHLQDLFDEEFEEAVENIMAEEASTSGRPPAAQTVLQSLPSVVVVHDSDGEKPVCAVCKEEVAVGGIVKRLPCSHGYHEECILPWLRMRNTCPVCRFELPTDDPGYEARRVSREGAGESGGDRGRHAPRGRNLVLEYLLHDGAGF